MLLDRIAKVAGKAVRGVTLTVGTVGSTVINEVKGVPGAFIDGLTAGEGLVKSDPLQDVGPTETEVGAQEPVKVEKSVIPKQGGNNKSIFEQ